MDLIERLTSKGLIKPPSFVQGGTHYLTIMGSFAYGVSSETSDMDIYGFCIPPRDMIFPHLKGEILGFGTPAPRFEQYQIHGIKEKDHNKEYDLNIYNIIKYFHLVMGCNPNMIDSLFTEQNCVLKSTKVADHMRDNRKLFLHKGAWHTFKGYAYSQMHKMKIKEPSPDSKRFEMVQKYGFDVKFAYHVVRLLNEVEQILIEGDLDLKRNTEQLKSIRRGEWTLNQIEDHFVSREKSLEDAYVKSTLPHRADEARVKKILTECLEEHFGSLEGMVQDLDHNKNILRQIQALVAKV